jgi:transcriptional regulator with XRE-family HTH domain
VLILLYAIIIVYKLKEGKNMTDFGKFLRKLRIDHDEVLYDMSRNLKVSSAFLSSVENGIKSVPKDLVIKIVDFYRLEPKQTEELQKLADMTTKQVRLNLGNVNEDKRNLALAFARRFDSMEQIEIQKLLRALSSNKEGE